MTPQFNEAVAELTGRRDGGFNAAAVSTSNHLVIIDWDANVDRVNQVVKACRYHDQLVQAVRAVIDAEARVGMDKDYTAACQNRIDVHLGLESLMKEIEP
jgi:putative hemolysin